MKQQTYLAVDLGAESGRVIAGRFDGQRMTLEPVHRFANGPTAIAGTARWDVLRLWSEIQHGLTQAADTFGTSIQSVGVDTWGVDYVLLTKNDEMLGQPYHYRDRRTEGMLQHAFSRVPKRDIFDATGLQFLDFNTLYQLLAMQATDPQLLKLADRFLMMPDFLHWCLCGSRVVEFTNATTTQCFHATENNWAFDLLQRFELPANIFPEVVSPGTTLGTIRDDVSQRTGLSRINVVTPATHDTGSAIVAVPTENTGSANWAYISSGTWSLMGAEVSKPVVTADAFRWNFTNEGGVDGTYRLLKNIMGLWLVQECRRSFLRAGRSLNYEQITEAAKEAEPFRSLINPDDPRFLNPVDMPSAIREYCQEYHEPIPKTDGQLIRCALESLALKYRMVLGWLEQLTGEPVEVLHIVGGGTQNEMLNQLTADACQRPVITGPVEATALGNLLLQARTAGEIGSLSEIRAIVRNSCTVKTYQPGDATVWKSAFARFEGLTISS